MTLAELIEEGERLMRVAQEHADLRQWPEAERHWDLLHALVIANHARLLAVARAAVEMREAHATMETARLKECDWNAARCQRCHDYRVALDRMNDAIRAFDAAAGGKP